jgi:adenosylcobinamide-GDP ribazoletransferase
MNWTFPLALTFLTKAPWPWRGEAGPEALARSMFWFPWVGALLGLAIFGVWWGLFHIIPADPVVAALLLIFSVWATGGLHLDGLADTADGIGGGREPADRLRIMKDSRLGTFGAASLVLVLLLKFALLGEAPRLWTDLILYPVISRGGMVMLAFLSPYARPEGGLGEAMTRGVSRRTAVGVCLSTLALAWIISGFRGLILLAGAAVLVGCGRVYFRKKLGGVTGDVLGAANEILEVLVLAGSVALGAYTFNPVSRFPVFW